MTWLLEPWPWWLSGLFIGLTVPLLYILGGKAFGISTSFQEVGSLCAPHSRFAYLRDFDRKGHLWTLVFVLGIASGGFVASKTLGPAAGEFLPASFHNASGIVKLLIGGFLVGFGARYAGGCTSGHSLTGIANINWPSLLATICFFAGGMAVTWGLGRWIF
ncbi:MAG: YeeE/YedE family protein [Planctomycetales bacterium]|nr:YeeE/YedE family protein [Planctomycetales bacterium]